MEGRSRAGKSCYHQFLKWFVLVAAVMPPENIIRAQSTTKTASTASTTTTAAAPVEAAPTAAPTTAPPDTTLLDIGTTLFYTPGLGWWSAWTNWNSCAGQCEWGKRHRSRECPRDYCEGEDAQTVVCDLPVYCSYGGWTVWGGYEPYSACDKACGTGSMTTIRRRTCTDSTAGPGCPGSATNYSIYPCNTDPCFLHGGWSAWGQWSDTVCSTTCGYGTITRTRMRLCTNPQPSGGGRNCEGSNWEIYDQTCENEEACATTTMEITTYPWPDAPNPSIYIITITLVGVPVIVGLYFTIGALLKAFCVKPKPNPVQETEAKRSRYDIYDYDDEWANNLPPVAHAVDMPNMDISYIQPIQPGYGTRLDTTIL